MSDLDLLSKPESVPDNRYRGKAARLLAERNDWSAWMADYEVERLSWMRLAAMLLRNVPVAMVANRLAAGIAARQAFEAEIILEMFEDDPAYQGRVVDWAFWLDRWGSGCPIDDLVADLDWDLFGSYGAELSFCRGAEDKGSVTPRAVLWFLLSAIRGWAKHGRYTGDVKPAARWILDLHRDGRADADPIAALLAHFYDRFREGGYAPTAPLPETLDIETPWMVRSVRRLESASGGSAG